MTMTTNTTATVMVRVPLRGQIIRVMTMKMMFTVAMVMVRVPLRGQTIRAV